jgi:hypothetical protein
MKLSLVLHLLLAGLMVIAWYPYFRALVTI